jgi:type III restriction enzyme
MGMLAAWSILNKANDRRDARFSDVVLVVCPNVTIRQRLAELDPLAGEASLYRTRDLVPPHLMADLTKGRVLVTNWHVFEPQAAHIGGVSARVSRAGVPVRVRDTVTIGDKTTTARGKRYLTLADLERQVASGLLTVLGEEHDTQGHLKRVQVESLKYVESDTALTPAKPGATKPPGCASPSTPLARPTGRATARADSCTLKVLVSWRRSWDAPYTHRGVMCAALSA